MIAKCHYSSKKKTLQLSTFFVTLNFSNCHKKITPKKAHTIKQIREEKKLFVCAYFMAKIGASLMGRRREGHPSKVFLFVNLKLWTHTHHTPALTRSLGGEGGQAGRNVGGSPHMSKKKTREIAYCCSEEGR